MRTTWVLAGTLIAAVLSISCGGDGKSAGSAAPAKQIEHPKPVDESRRFPKTNLTGTEVVDRELLGKPFMPGGTIAHYAARHSTGKIEYDMFAARVADANAAAFLLPDWRTSLSGAQLVPSFGGYFGSDAGRQVFVFSKGAWIAGVVGLPLKDADTEARTLAARLD